MPDLEPVAETRHDLEPVAETMPNLEPVAETMLDLEPVVETIPGAWCLTSTETIWLIRDGEMGGGMEVREEGDYIPVATLSPPE